MKIGVNPRRNQLVVGWEKGIPCDKMQETMGHVFALAGLGGHQLQVLPADKQLIPGATKLSVSPPLPLEATQDGGQLQLAIMIMHLVLTPQPTFKISRT